MSEPTVSQALTTYSAERLLQLQAVVAACCDRLSEQQLQHRGAPHENSIVNLLLHLEGNLRQWIVHGIGGAPDVRQRDAEFTLHAPPSAAEARAAFDRAVAEAVRIAAALPASRLLEIVDPQPTGRHRYPTVLVALLKAVGHLDHHTGQIIVLTKQLAGHDLDLSMPRPR